MAGSCKWVNSAKSCGGMVVCLWALLEAEVVMGGNSCNDWVIDVGDGDDAEEGVVSDEDHHALPIKMCFPSLYRFGMVYAYPFRLDKDVSGSSTATVMESSASSLVGRR